MSSPFDESLILRCLLAGVWLCVALLVVARLWLPAGGGKPGNVLWPYDPARVPPALPGQWWHTLWARRDAVLALGTAGVLSLLMGPLTTSGEGAGAGMSLTADRMLTQLIFQLSVAGIVLMLLGRGGRDVVRMLGLEPARIKPSVMWALMWITPLYIGIALLGALLMFTLQDRGIQMQEQVFVRALRDLDQPEIYGLVWLSLGIGAPLMEELVFRGLLYRVACRYFNLPAATVLSALFFAVVHNNLLSFLPLFLLGVVFAVAYERYRSLYVPFLMHAIFNTVQFLIMLYVPQVTQ